MPDHNHCVLIDYRKDKCGHCSDLCPHRISLHGLSGDGGRIAAANVPKDYQYVTIQTSPARDGQQRIYKITEKYVETFKRTDGSRVKSLYLWSSNPGTGKTTTASAILNQWVSVEYLTALKEGRQPEETKAYFLDVNEWQTEYNNFNRPRVPDHIAEPAAEKYYKGMEKAKKAEFAVLDDIGVRDATEGFRSDLHTVINYRATNGLPTVYTSNYGIEDMSKIFDNRMYDRIRDQCVELHFNGESQRKGK